MWKPYIRPFGLNREKYWLGSSALLAASFLQPYPTVTAVSSVCLLYNVLERMGVLQVNFLLDKHERKKRAGELLRYHILQSPDMQRYSKADTLLVALPNICFEDQGIIGFIKSYFNLEKNSKDTKFYMSSYFKDVKYQGEGTAFCEGQFISIDNYYFTKVLLKQTKPMEREVQILDTDYIEVS